VIKSARISVHLPINSDKDRACFTWRVSMLRPGYRRTSQCTVTERTCLTWECTSLRTSARLSMNSDRESVFGMGNKHTSPKTSWPCFAPTKIFSLFVDRCLVYYICQPISRFNIQRQPRKYTLLVRAYTGC